MTASNPILYTITDEAPALATGSLLPIVSCFLRAAGIPVETRDISLAGRILAVFADRLPSGQQMPDALAELGQLAKTPEANIIKLPNISASVPQLKAAIAELKDQGFALPDYPDEAKTPDEQDIKDRYDRVKGSAVNPVLREGNSDRRAPKAVKEFARENPPPMRPWSKDCPAHVATMSAGDFRHNEVATTLVAATTARIEFVSEDGEVTVLKDGLKLEAGEVLDATRMERDALHDFLASTVAEAKAEGLLWSLHMKATMMKVSDPIIFGHAVRAFFAPVFERFGAEFEAAGVSPNNGLGDLLAHVATLPAEKAKAIEDAVQAALAEGPAVAMVNSDRGITNLHVPSDIIIDASMPPMIRDGGQMWNAEGKLQPTKAVIPDSSYAGVFQATIDFCKAHGAFDPKTMGSVANVGLMAKKAEEYGSHDKTFEITAAGRVRIVDAEGTLLLEREVQPGDIWRACQTKDAPIRNWVALGVERARLSGSPAVFWLDASRAHDAEVLKKVEEELKGLDTTGLDLRVMAPAEATTFTCERIAKGEDVISITGNVLRDYLTDLFPILEVGTSAKMLSIVPLMNGGGLFETGAGGSAPKHVQQFVEEGHLRWDSLGEFLALAVSLEHYARRHDRPAAQVLATTLDQATTKLLLTGKSPSRKVGELDNRGSHYFLARYWAEELAAQTDDADLAARFAPLAQGLAEGEAKILGEIAAAEGQPVDLGGYYRPNPEALAAAMRPSATLNALLAEG